jgi:hypothetical protein
LSKNKAGAKIFLFSNARDEDRSPPSMTIWFGVYSIRLFSLPRIETEIGFDRYSDLLRILRDS